MLESLFRFPTPTQVFSCEYYEILKKTYFEVHLRTTASEQVCSNSFLTIFYFSPSMKTGITYKKTPCYNFIIVVVVIIIIIIIIIINIYHRKKFKLLRKIACH